MNVSFEYVVFRRQIGGTPILSLKGGAPLMPTAVGEGFATDNNPVLTVQHIQHHFINTPGGVVQQYIVVVN